ncbi:hypothetical protein I79_009391 [Cricetulus griseus]|uniref:Uncharacterized protein n=1 Tax=Cricetulus griseus TaxID=10029 RepID=G3HFM9_CRIGR|nr:hypothetical protein I79_009391 [Cricetulus griseus]
MTWCPGVSRAHTLLNCSSCSVSSSTACVCFCLISWTWASWDRVSSSKAFFSTVTSCSLLALGEKNTVDDTQVRDQRQVCL